MAQRESHDDLAFGSDSFLDVVANIVGILIILIVVAGLLAGTLFPALWFYSRFDTTEARGLIGVAILSAILIGLSSITRGGNRSLEAIGP